jgi:exodeoxyribonuclease V alpha subunit
MFKSPPSVVEFLQGAIERITYHSEASGFCVLRVKVKDHRDLVTVTGHSATVTAGEYVEAQGV